MEVLKSVWRSPVTFRKKQKHKKVPEDQWGQAEDPIIDGVGFHLKYIGSTLVDELPEGQSYGSGISSDAVKTIVVMAKSKGNKLDKASLKISSSGIEVIDLTRDYTISQVSIDRICFCTADKHHEKVFAFIVRNTENETMECHAFLCDNRKMAHAVTLTVAQAFSVANDKEKELSDNVKNPDVVRINTDSPIFQAPHPGVPRSSLDSTPTSSPCSQSLSSPCSSPLTVPLVQVSDTSNEPLVQVNDTSTDTKECNIEEVFNLEDSFSKLAQMRVHSDEPGF